MKFTIEAASAPKKNIPFVFFIFEKGEIEKNPLFNFLTSDEKKYIIGIKKNISGKDKEVRVLITPDAERKIIIVGLGEQKSFNTQKTGIAMRVAAQTARKEKLRSFAFSMNFSDIKTEEAARDLAEIIATNAVMANFEFVKYKTPPPDGFAFLEEIQAIYSGADKFKSAFAEGLRRGLIIGEETNACRELANMPGGDMTPEILSNHAEQLAKKLNFSATILDEKKIKSLGMGGVLGVAKGSDAAPRFIILEYWGAGKNSVGKNNTEKPIVLVGKGVTFDTGGLNLKPDEHIYEMHMDMSGGAAVIHTVAIAARLKLKKNVIALVPAVENMPSGSSYRPGDVLRTMSGKTIEVLNTDAEGRIILADALEYAKRYDPEIVIDVATLTGAACVALGLRYSAIFTSRKILEDTLRSLGDAVGDPVWPLPLTADYEDDVRGTFGDWANIGKQGRMGGAITGAVFLWQFTKNAKNEEVYPWVHLDTAPRMTSIEGEYLAKGAAGAPVRLLAKFLEKS